VHTRSDGAEAEAQQAAYETLVIPNGTNVVASLDTQLSTETNHTGDSFRATTTEPIMVGGRTAVPSGASIHGVLRDVQASGRVEGRARMTLAYETLVDSQGKTHTLSALPLTLQAASSTATDVEKIAAGGVLGAIIGGIAGGGKGAAIGAGAGAGAGTILMLATKGDEWRGSATERQDVRSFEVLPEMTFRRPAIDRASVGTTDPVPRRASAVR
jgi:outer membrane lipoprotein SlyB